MRALVTGGTGFVGSHLIDHLLERGDAVTALVRTPARAAGLAGRGVRLVRGDLADARALAEAVEGQEVVYHVAALVGALAEAEFVAANRDGTAAVVRAAEAAGRPRLVLCSSMAAGGPSARGVPRTGAEPDRPVTAYGRSKLASEAVVRASALPWTILRPPTVYGPRDRENFLKLFAIARRGLVPVFGDGSMELSLVYAADFARAMTAAAAAPATEGRTYYANHPERLTSAELAAKVGRVVGRRVRVVPLPEPLTRGILAVTGGVAALLRRNTILRPEKANEFYQPAWTGDPAPLARDAGWTAAHDADAGLAATHAWYREAGWL